MKPNVQKGVPILSTNLLTSWICAELEVLIHISCKGPLFPPPAIWLRWIMERILLTSEILND